jgi:transposase-like protein
MTNDLDLARHSDNLATTSRLKLAALMDESEVDVLAYMAFPAQHRTKLHSTNPIERLRSRCERQASALHTDQCRLSGRN